ncbi:MAG: sulfatase-like hydrolase/transferase [Planctomycetota bacterium]|nr:sulfatase-like hydrolase/transferase [Planctomycetota bacterium]
MPLPKHPSKNSDETRCPVSLALSFVVTQLVLHGWWLAASGGMLMPHLVGWVQDSAILLVMALLLGWSFRRANRQVALKRLATATTTVTVITAGVLLASYTPLLDDFLLFPVNLLATDRETAWFFFSDYLGWAFMRTPVAGLALGLAIYWRGGRFLDLRRPSLIAVPLVVLTLASLGRPAPNPFVYSLQATVQSWFRPRKVPSLTRPVVTTPSATAEEESAVFDTASTLRYRHLLLIVLESVDATVFERQFLANPNGYFARVRHRSAYYASYHATNLDSHTSLIAMLTSVFVPYRAYTDARLYENADRASNMVHSLRQRGFQTLFVSTFDHQPFVPVRQDWQRIITRGDLPAQPGLVAIGSSRMESAVEDLAAMPTIVEWLSTHDRTVILHEMAYGHSQAWASKTGESQLAYYDRYLRALLDKLEQAKLAEETLVVVVADHGLRANAADPQNYHIPLLVTGAGVAACRDNSFRSHLDLQRILAYHAAGAVLSTGGNSILTVGSSDRWVYGEVRKDGACLFVDNGTGTIMRSAGGLAPDELYRRFQAEVQAFAARWQH